MNPTLDYLSEVSASSPVQALSQINWISAAVNSLLSGEYHRKKQDELEDFFHLLHSKLLIIEGRYVDKEYFSTDQGKRAFAMAFRSLLKDSRKEKIQSMSTLLTNLAIKSKLTFDERELYIDILDDLNPFHLVVLGRIYEFIKENKPVPRRFEPSGIASYFKDKGIDEQLTHQAISILSTYFIVNRGNGGTIGDGGLQHYFTDFGEKFYDFITRILTDDINSPWLEA